MELCKSDVTRRRRDKSGGELDGLGDDGSGESDESCGSIVGERTERDRRAIAEGERSTLEPVGGVGSVVEGNRGDGVRVGPGEVDPGSYTLARGRPFGRAVARVARDNAVDRS